MTFRWMPPVGQSRHDKARARVEKQLAKRAERSARLRRAIDDPSMIDWRAPETQVFEEVHHAGQD